MAETKTRRGDAELSPFALCMERPECLVGFGIGLEIVGLLDVLWCDFQNQSIKFNYLGRNPFFYR
jgi:hypothetical protein